MATYFAFHIPKEIFGIWNLIGNSRYSRSTHSSNYINI
jgi:hypothetical protein